VLRKRLAVFGLMVVSLAAAGAACAAGYNDCVLENLRGVGSDLAAREIMRACREKFSGRQAVGGAPIPRSAVPTPNRPQGEERNPRGQSGWPPAYRYGQPIESGTSVRPGAGTLPPPPPN
jgi:hypothetical protein